jgi:hypothetical protein
VSGSAHRGVMKIKEYKRQLFVKYAVVKIETAIATSYQPLNLYDILK